MGCLLILLREEIVELSINNHGMYSHGMYSHEILNQNFCFSGILVSIMTWYLSERSKDPQTELQPIDLKNSWNLLILPVCHHHNISLICLDGKTP